MNPFEKMLPAVLIDADDLLSKGISDLKKADACVVVTKGGAYQGILDDRSIERMSADPSTTKVGKVMERAPLIENGASLYDICKLFFTGPYKSLPVRDRDKIIGIMKREYVIESLMATGALSGRVRDFMTSPAVTVSRNATLAQAKAKMREMNVRRLIVFDDNRLGGLVSTYDLKASVPKQKAPFVKEKFSQENPPVASVMTEEVISVSPDATLNEAARTMVQNDIVSLVVMQDNKPVGLLSARDLFESIMFKEKAPLHISGLDEETRQFADEITSACEAEMERLGKSFEIEYLAMHFKRYGRKHSIHARLKTAKQGIISASNHGFDLQGALHGVLLELRKILMEKKDDPMHDKRRKPFRGLE